MVRALDRKLMFHCRPIFVCQSINVILFSIHKYTVCMMSYPELREDYELHETLGSGKVYFWRYNVIRLHHCVNNDVCIIGFIILNFYY